MNRAALEEPTIPARLRRPLAAVWISIGVHAALIALIQVAPPTSPTPGTHVIEARLVDVEGPQRPELPQTTAESAPHEPEAPPKPVPPGTEPPAERTPVAAAKPLPARQDESPDALPAADAPVRRESPSPEPADGPPAPSPAGAEPRTPVAPLEVTSAVDLTYYSARELDVQPRALRDIVPDYPPNADRSRISGTVRLQVELEADGRVRDVRVVSADPPGVFEDSARAAFREARFAPAQRNGRPVRSRVLIEVVYDWEGRN